ncbi:MAG TPA: ABC transporter ATP-binding protein [Candidatus Aminicenantes bacterium]|nr:ABC transporter ATP-binding protein [Candidatus Aminicenantes bacterium]HRY66063.1 ABC transporter ATP-binding protein [Candidatus Aminicenantes bacterium]HRZ72888.1 ABC transporter ATP-binding protein [Candidatus Aminicenantes bacterium]
MSEPVLAAEGLGKTYPLPKGELRVFEGLDFSLGRGELAAVMGASGVGKTTLLNLLGGLDRPTEGRIRLDGEDLFAGSDREVASVRNRKIGFVFQVYHLLPEFTAVENVAFPAMIAGLPRREAFGRALDMLRDVGLEDKAHSRPGRLSGGEQQRVAIARALVNRPCLLLADEPTGNLDWKTGEKVLRLVLDLHASRGLSSVLVTHNEKIARFCDKVYVMEAGAMKLQDGIPS